MSYSRCLNLKEIDSENFDVLVIGKGLAGLSAAYASAKQGKETALFSAHAIEESSSYKAKGGISLVLGKTDSDELHVKDTLATGKGLCKEEIVRFVVSQASERLNEFIDLGLEFDLDDQGELDLGLEGGHCRKRVLHINGDNTGKGLVEFLIKLCRENNVHFFDKHGLVQFASEKKRLTGALFMQTNDFRFVHSNATVLATGGYAALFEHTSNSPFSLGEGISVSKKAGAVLEDLEFVQFHPTTMLEKHEHLLVTESVRGEKGIIVDKEGNKIVDELATRDEVSRAVYNSVLNGKNVFIDVRHLGKIFLNKRFPSFYSDLNKIGINPVEELVPIVPAAHYTIGGVKIDASARTSLQGLFAAGEVSCSGLHGANRLPCNSLLEAIVMGYTAGKNASQEKAVEKSDKLNLSSEQQSRSSLSAEQGLKKIRELMWENCGIVRTGKALEKAVSEIKEFSIENSEEFSLERLRFENTKNLAELVLESAFAREESRGVHYRNDFPKENVKFMKHTIV